MGIFGLEPCKGKRLLLFNRRSRTHQPMDPAETMGIRLKEGGGGAFSRSLSYQSSHISSIEGLDLVGIFINILMFL